MSGIPGDVDEQPARRSAAAGVSNYFVNEI